MSPAPTTSPAADPKGTPVDPKRSAGVTAAEPERVRGKSDRAMIDDERRGQPTSDREINQGFDQDPLRLRELLQDFTDLAIDNPQALHDILWIHDDWKDPRFNYRWVNKYGQGSNEIFPRRLNQGYVVLTSNNRLESENFPTDRFDSQGEFRSGVLVLARCPRETWEKRQRRRLLEAISQKVGIPLQSLTPEIVQAEYDKQIASGALNPTGVPDPRSPAARRVQTYRSPLLS